MTSTVLFDIEKDVDSGLYQCKECSKAYPMKFMYNNHVLKVHSERAPPPIRERKIYNKKDIVVKNNSNQYDADSSHKRSLLTATATTNATSAAAVTTLSQSPSSLSFDDVEVIRPVVMPSSFSPLIANFPREPILDDADYETNLQRVTQYASSLIATATAFEEAYGATEMTRETLRSRIDRELQQGYTTVGKLTMEIDSLQQQMTNSMSTSQNVISKHSHDDPDDDDPDDDDDDDDDDTSTNNKRRRKSTMTTVYDTFDYDIPKYFPLMLRDEARNRLFRDAIFAVGAQFRREHGGRAPRVLDVGAGTGLLSIFAARAGAALVVGIEANAQRAEIARRNISAHKLDDVCTIVTCVSTEFQLRTCHARQPFDVLVCELLGTTAIYERQNTFIGDLFTRGIVRSIGGSRYVVPQSVEMWIQPYRSIQSNSSGLNDTGVHIVDQLVVKRVAKKEEFQHHSKFGVLPHTNHFVHVDRLMLLINQPSWTSLTTIKKMSVELRLQSPDGNNFLFIEWRARLWSNIYLEHSLQSASSLPNDNYAARIGSWGFDVYVPPSDVKSITFSLTNDNVVVKRLSK